MEASLWNIGLKVEDLDREIDFLEALGAKVLVRESRTKPDGEEYECALLEFGGTRLFLIPEPVFENKLNHQLMPGLTHAVFEVDDLDKAYEQLTKLGAEVLIEPRQISTGMGSRRISFYRSPNGLVFEVMQILESKV
jgi:catechol 2,3-dioxygenase-like lactoylglutathione lyase family enzyme